MQKWVKFKIFDNQSLSLCSLKMKKKLTDGKIQLNIYTVWIISSSQIKCDWKTEEKVRTAATQAIHAIIVQYEE